MKENYSSEERREQRRLIRQRNQRLAYSVMMGVLLAIVVIAVIFIVKGKKNDSGSVPPGQSPGGVEDAFASEVELTPPPMTTAEPVATMSPEELFEQEIDAMIAEMTIVEKVAGLFIITPEALTGVGTAVEAGEGTKDALTDYPVGGLIYFSKNIQSREQLMQMIANTKEYSRYPIFIAIDEEGGSVNRVATAGLGEKQSSAAAIGATGDPNNAYLAGSTIGTYLAELGFNLDFAPVADLSNISGSVMKDRAYGSTAEAASPYVAAMVTGLQEQGVMGCLKHFPGIGSTTADTHNGFAYTDRTVEEFRSEEFKMFQAGIDAGAQMIMVGHMTAENLTNGQDGGGSPLPASMSPTIITGYLRNELGYQGVIITDALNMSAISDYYSSEQAAVLALKAGCDMILMPESFFQAYAGVLNAVRDGVISEERINDSLRRIYRIKYAEGFNG